jgi:hypothetical protein
MVFALLSECQTQNCGSVGASRRLLFTCGSLITQQHYIMDYRLIECVSVVSRYPAR